MFTIYVSITLIIFFTLSGGEISSYYITNSSELIVRNESCHFNRKMIHPCVTLTTLVSKKFSTQIQEVGNISLIFLNKHYNLRRQRATLTFASQSKVEISSWNNQSQTFLNCSGDFAFEFANVHEIIVNSVIFHQCGNSRPVISINDSFKIVVQHSHFFNSRMQIFGQQSNIVVKNSLFDGTTNNYALKLTSTAFVDGYFDKITFSNNTKGSLLISTATRRGSLRFNSCIFLNNSAESSANHSIMVNSVQDVNLTNCIFDNNTLGGALYVGHHHSSSNLSLLVIENCRFINNAAANGGAIKVTNSVNYFLRNSIFNGNSARDYGGALSIEPSNKQFLPQRTSIIMNCTFHNNSARVGGAVFITSPKSMGIGQSRLLVQNSIFSSNRGATGGALALYIHQLVTLENTSLIGNKASYIGGAIYCEKSIMLINTCLFYQNSASMGGGLHVEIEFLIKNSSFLENNASNGSAIFADIWVRSLHEINFTTFIRNRATEYGGALSIKSMSPVLIANCTFLENSASFGGAIAFLLRGRFSCNFWMNVTGCNFTANIAIQGGGVASSSRCSLNFTDSLFQTNQAESGGAAFLRDKAHTIVFSKCRFDHNLATRGGAIASYGPSIDDFYIMVSDCKFFNNAALVQKHTVKARLDIEDCEKSALELSGEGGAIFLQASNTSVITRSYFERNKAYKGGAMYLYVSVSVTQQSVSVGNEACTGGAFHANDSTFTLVQSSVIGNRAWFSGGGIFSISSTLTLRGSTKFYNNIALSLTGIGGAIHVMDLDKDCKINSCPLQWSNATKLNFTNNSANKGPVIFGGMLDRCNKLPGGEGHSAIANGLWINGARYNLSSYDITSEAISICFCHNNILSCEKSDVNKDVLPGHSMKIQMMCIDQLKQPVPCTVRGEYDSREIELGKGENARFVDSCNILSYNAFSEAHNSGVLNLLGSTLCSANNQMRRLRVHVKILPCPVGFQNIEKQCQCDHRLMQEFSRVQCDISNKSVTLDTPGWFSYGNGRLRLYKNCPLNYCFRQKRNVLVSKPDTQCKYYRRGILCGGCVANYSVLLGSWKCMDCSHLSRYNFIWLTALLGLAGVVLVVFLLLVKMTVSSGTTNGLIFYANILSFSGLLDYHTCSIHPVLRVFLSWINLDLGIEVCYYSGMDVYQKTWLQFIFPFYIWFLVGVIILFCHYSSRVMKLMGMRNIEVLATLFLLSYSKLLKTIVTAFSYTDLKVARAENVSDPLILQKVWTYDGNIDILSHKHLILFSTALIIFIFIFIPYTAMLIFGQCLKFVPRRRGLNWVNGKAITAVIDAYHAPYTKHHRYWTGLGLLVRCILFTLFGIGYSLNTNLLLIVVAVFTLFIIRMSSGVIYQQKIANLLEIFYLGNLGILALVLLYSGSACTLLTVSVSLSFFGFIYIFGYHIYLSVKSKNCTKLRKCLITMKPTTTKSQLRNDNKEEEKEDTSQGYSVSYFDLRETLIN